jgi:hypothetical protein
VLRGSHNLKKPADVLDGFSIDPGPPPSGSDNPDQFTQHTLEAAKNACGVLLTCDGGMLSRSAAIGKECSVSVQKPSDFVARQGMVAAGDRRAARPVKITIGEMRSSGVTGVLMYCSDHKCSPRVAASAEDSPDDVRLSDLEGLFTCTVCGKKGADIRPD